MPGKIQDQDKRLGTEMSPVEKPLGTRQYPVFPDCSNAFELRIFLNGIDRWTRTYNDELRVP